MVNVAVVPLRVVIAPDAPRSCVAAVVPNVVPVSVVMLAEVLLRFVTVPDVKVPSVVPVNVVMLDDVAVSVVI